MGRIGWYKGAMNQYCGGTTLYLGANCWKGWSGMKHRITLNADALGYKIPTHADIPDYHFYLNETPDPYGPFGLKGISEPMGPAVGAAIANAIYNACGARLDSTPFTPDKILAALGKA